MKLVVNSPPRATGCFYISMSLLIAVPLHLILEEVEVVSVFGHLIFGYLLQSIRLLETGTRLRYVL